MSFKIRDAAGKEITVAGLGGGGSANAVTVPGGAAITMGDGIGAGGYQFKFTPEGDAPELTASDVGYDHAESGLAATTVQGAVDEVAGKLAIDGVPVGAVMSFLCLTAPSGYLVCDGATYSMADYPALSAFIASQFGSANHFGGDGTATFAVPDMRNLFLRGYHGTAEEQLSGDVGARQEGTTMPTLQCNAGENFGYYIDTRFNLPQQNADSASSTIGEIKFVKTELRQSMDKQPVTYTARPVNMAILYCIKSV